jgi:hypothetical protein
MRHAAEGASEFGCDAETGRARLGAGRATPVAERRSRDAERRRRSVAGPATGCPRAPRISNTAYTDPA